VKYLENYIKENPVDLIVSNGPPHSMHLIGRALKKKTGIPWVADFRDPWTKIDYYHHLPLMKWADRKHKRLEKAVLSEANLVTSHSWETSKDFASIGQSKVEVITNGFDDVDFPDDITFNNPNFEITHVGSINSDRDTPLLWEVLEEVAAEDAQFNTDLRIKLVGKIDISTKRTIANYKYENEVEFIDFVPHEEACRIMQNSTVLLLLLKKIPTIKAVIPGKIFEYLAAKRPILCLGSDNGDSARILKEVNAGVAINHGDRTTLKREIINLYQSFKEGSLKGGVNFHQYARKNLAKKYASLLDEVLASHQKNQ
jgi:glycosyltransferase involved in cell wall biosynthesis